MASASWHPRLLSTTRGQVLDALWRAPRAVDELAAALGLSRNAVRSHLTSLERDGLVRHTAVRRSPAKRAFVYEVTSAAEAMFPSAYAPVLGQLLESLGERLPPAALEALLKEVALRLAHDAGTASGRSGRQRVERAAAVLSELGGIVDVEEAPTRPHTVWLRGYRCPLGALTTAHAELCQLLEGFVAEIVGAEVQQHCERGSRPHCCFEIALDRQRAA